MNKLLNISMILVVFASVMLSETVKAFSTSDVILISQYLVAGTGVSTTNGQQIVLNGIIGQPIWGNADSDRYQLVAGVLPSVPTAIDDGSEPVLSKRLFLPLINR